MRRFKKILCVVEPDEDSEAALAQAVKIAGDHQAVVTVASVLKIDGAWRKYFSDRGEIEKGLNQSADIKRLAIEKWINSIEPELKINVEIFSGIGFIEIVQRVVNDQYDLLVKCASEAKWLDRLFGSDDMHLLRKCPCPVLMLKPGQAEVFRNVLATVDVSDVFNEPEESRVQDQLNRKVLEYGAVFSVSELTNMHIGSAWDAYGEDFLRYGAFAQLPEDQVDSYVRQAREEYSEELDVLVSEMKDSVGKDTVDYLLPRVHLVKGHPSEEIPLMAKKYNVDLIVMGTVARAGIPGFIIGNTAESILEQVQCSVLAVKPDGFVSPVGAGTHQP